MSYSHASTTLEERHVRLVREDQAAAVTYQGYNLALWILVLSQVIYLNLQYVMAIILTGIVCVFIVIQVIINAREFNAIDKSDYIDFARLYRAHQWILHTLMLLTIPFLIWTAVLMAQKHPVV